MYSLQKIITIATVIGVNLIVATPAISQESHSSPNTTSQESHSSPSTTLPKHQSPPRTTPRTTKIQSLTPKEREAERFLNQALEKLAEKDYRGALEDYNQALLLNPDHEFGFINRGELRHKLGDNQGAIDDYTKAIERNPSFAYIYVSRGDIHQALGDHMAAIKDYTQAIEIYPEDGIGYSHRGVAHNKLGNSQEAIADLNKAIEINPGRADAYLNRGNIYTQLGDKIDNPEEAAAFYKKATTDYQQAAILFSEQGNIAESQSAMNIMQALKQRPVPARSHL